MVPQSAFESLCLDREGVGRLNPRPIKCEHWFHHVLSHAEDRLHGRDPFEFAKEVRVFSGLVIVMRDLQEGRKAVKLKVTGPDDPMIVARGHMVGGAIRRDRDSSLRRWEESVAVWRCIKVASLEIDDASEQRRKFVRRRLQDRTVGLHLVRRVAKPHGVNVTCNQEAEIFLGVVSSKAFPCDCRV